MPVCPIKVRIFACLFVFPYITLHFNSTLGGGNVKAYFIIVQPKFTHNLGLLSIIWFTILLTRGGIRLGPAQDVHFFYTRSHLGALQKCALLYQPIFSLLSHLKYAIHNLSIEWCSILKVSKKITVIY